MRPADKLKLWTGGFINMPGVRPPAYLKFVLTLCALSLVAAMAYGAFSILGHVGGGDTLHVIVEAFILFILPFAILYSISSNIPASRVLMVIYFASTSAVLARSYKTPDDLLASWPAASFVLFTIVTLIWLYFAPKSRVYYSLIGKRPVPEHLQHIIDDLVGPATAPNWIRRLGQLVEPFSAIALIAIALFLVYAGFANMSPN